jgi:hypothetical protein
LLDEDLFEALLAIDDAGGRPAPAGQGETPVLRLALDYCGTRVTGDLCDQPLDVMVARARQLISEFAGIDRVEVQDALRPGGAGGDAGRAVPAGVPHLTGPDGPVLSGVGPK